MSLVGRVEVGPSPGQEALRSVPGMVLRVEDIRATADEPWRFIFWASGDEFDRYEEALEDDPTVASFKCLTKLSERRLYRIVLSDADRARSLHPITIEQDITIISLTITAESEEVLARFPDRDALFTYRDACRELGRNFELRNLYEERPDDREGTNRYGVTDAQQEALSYAVEQGYFDVPRGTTMEAMAADLGVSTAALSTRLRRGQRALLRHTVAADGI